MFLLKLVTLIFVYALNTSEENITGQGRSDARVSNPPPTRPTRTEWSTNYMFYAVEERTLLRCTIAFKVSMFREVMISLLCSALSTVSDVLS